MHIQFAELAVFDQDRAIAFYTQHLGCAVVADVPMDASGWRWVELSFAGAETHLHFLRRDNDDLSEFPVLVLLDDDLKATVETLRAGGVQITSEPQENPYEPGKIAAEFCDSEGNRIMLGSK